MSAYILAGSKFDKKIVNKVAQILREKQRFQIDYASTHREPEREKEIVKKSEACVFIAVAGPSAALTGFGKNSALDGLDALLSIVQMPKGIPTACVGINAAPFAEGMLRDNRG